MVDNVDDQVFLATVDKGRDSDKFLVILIARNRQVMCSVSELYVPEISTEMFRNNIILNGLTLCTYVIVWVVFTSRKAIKNDKANRRMLKSLTVVMLFVFFGWMLYSIARLVMPAFEFSNITTCNAIVLYIFSKEYRKLFQIQNQRLAHALGLSKKK
uniref:Uncharacterized protein n=1 Tax=Ditylenchus dipsaci TaxID=166011 RepID=A0A915EDM4_9BILA